MSDQTDWKAQGYALPPNEFSPEPEKPVPTGLQKLPNVWKYLTRGARPADSGTAGLDAFGNPLETTDAAPSKPELGKTPEEKRSAFSVDWEDEPAFDANSAAFDADAVFDTAPPDLPITHGDRPILESFSKHMGGQHGMTVTQIHQSLRWANSYDGSVGDMLNNYAANMSEYGLTPAQAQEAMRWFNGYAGSEEALDDAAVADVERAIAEIQDLMATPAYTKNEKMQSDYRMLLGILEGEE